MKNFKLKIIFITIISITLILASKISKASNEYTEINPIYDKIFTKEEKQYVLDKLEESSKETSQNIRVYNSVAIYTNSTYSKLIKEIQTNLLKRNVTINVMYKTNSANAEKIVSEKYATSSDLGDYILWNSGGWKANYGYSRSGSNYIYSIKYTMNYFTNYEQEQEVSDAIDNYLYTYNSKNKTKYEIIKDFNEYICQNVDYDYSTNYTNLLKYSAYAAIINHEAVCQGYSTLYYRLLKECGIDNRVVVSNKLNHAWNLVNYGCFWYFVDTTWSDAGDYPYQKYFMKNINNFGHGNLEDAEPSTNAYRIATKSLTQETITAIETATEHKHKVIQEMKATCGKSGYKIYECTTCKDTYKITTSALEHNYKTTITKRSTTSNSGSVTTVPANYYTVTYSKRKKKCWNI